MLESASKALSLVILKRLETAALALGVLTREQAGFRRHEECSAQIATLTEVITRRTKAGKITAHAYLDLKAAYDSVPHQALFANMRWLGFPSHLIDVIESIYKSGTTVVTYRGSVVGAATITCGLRQGCPMSPLLFNIYICHILHGRHDLEPSAALPNWVRPHPGAYYSGVRAVSVPGLETPSPDPFSYHRQVQQHATIPGLAYADDIVVFADSH